MQSYHQTNTVDFMILFLFFLLVHSKVFTLLEQIYNSFDAIAKRRKIFKVETIGDCYGMFRSQSSPVLCVFVQSTTHSSFFSMLPLDGEVAVAGLPEPRDDHAEVMARFSNECRWKMIAVVKRLEVLLGPDTSDLAMRFGLHSGPVTGTWVVDSMSTD
jgi:class 3 adenylate cyclase